MPDIRCYKMLHKALDKIEMEIRIQTLNIRAV